jgi:hypothetical protein
VGQVVPLRRLVTAPTLSPAVLCDAEEEGTQGSEGGEEGVAVVAQVQERGEGHGESAGRTFDLFPRFSLSLLTACQRDYCGCVLTRRVDIPAMCSVLLFRST